MTTDAPSSLPPSDDPYVLLGVKKDADEKELRRRYFTLMRQYPPETRPEEFNRIQRAYETLKDPEARAALSEAEPFEEVAEPYRTRLREVLAQLGEGREDLARPALEQLLQEQPELVDARDLLHRVLFVEERFADAEKHLAVLTEAKPEDTYYCYRHVLVLSRLERHDEAIREAERWLKLAGGKEPAAWQCLAETLSAAGRHDEAMLRLDEALKAVQPIGPVLLTRIHLRLDRGTSEALAEDLRLLAESIPEKDEGARQEAKERLKSLAALFFDRNKVDEANALLRAAKGLVGDAAAPLQFPHRTQLLLEELPATSQKWLEDEANEIHIFRILQRGKATDLLSAIVSTGATGLLAGLLLSLETTSAAAFLFLGFLLAVLLLWTVWSWREARWSQSSPLPRMTSVHPLYLLEVKSETVTAWPVVNLHDVNVVHQHVNGVYTASNVTLQFANKKLTVPVRGQEQSVQFVQMLQGFRYRALQLMHGGMLEAEEAYDFIPHVFLDPKHVSPARQKHRRTAWIRRLSAVGVAAALTLVAGLTSAHRASGAAWAKAVNAGSVRALQLELKRAPSEADAALATRWHKEEVARIQAGLARRAPSDAHRARAVAVTELLAAAPQPGLVLALRSSELAAPKVEMPATQYPIAPWTASPQLEASFVLGFNNALSLPARELARFLTPGERTQGAGVPVELTLQPYWTDQVAQVGRSRYALVGLKLEAKLGETVVPLDIQLTPEDLEALRSKDGLGAVATAEATALLLKAGRILAYDLGLSRSLARN